MSATFDSPAALVEAVAAGPVALGPGEWFTIDQARIDEFARATEDHQWIHVDVERAKAGPFGAPIAHGFLTLSLLSALASPLLDVRGVAMGVNYGFDRVRFLAPVTVGSRVRVVGQVTDATPGRSGVRVTQDLTVEIEESETPALAAQWLTLVVPRP
ncbi:MaoC family dehydratase [Agromyces sp. SYSU T00194]|uniref:MaoC family dehydratase n=1 Tax=Agromyces chitinivorans TaxID=3158560 RepID=UPI0033925A52